MDVPAVTVKNAVRQDRVPTSDGRIVSSRAHQCWSGGWIGVPPNLS
jgi:hypothetical protein